MFNQFKHLNMFKSQRVQRGKLHDLPVMPKEGKTGLCDVFYVATYPGAPCLVVKCQCCGCRDKEVNSALGREYLMNSGVGFKFRSMWLEA